MSTDVRLAKINNNVPISDNTTVKGPDIGNNLATGNDHATLTQTDETIKNEKSKRQTDFNTTLKNYKLSKENALLFFKELFNYTEEQLFDPNQVANEKYAKIMYLFEISLDFLINIAEVRANSGKKSDIKTGIYKSITEIKKLLDSGCEIDNIAEFLVNFENKDLIDILQMKCPQLRGKSIDQISPQELKEVFKTFINKTYDNGKKSEDPQAIMDFFIGTLGRCNDKEKAKIFYAFALLLKDKDMQGKIPEAYQKMTKSYENINELKKLISKAGPEILRILGIDDKTIKILNFEAISELDEKQIGGLINSLLQTFNEIDENDLPLIKKVLTSINNEQTDNLTEDELRIYNEKYKDLIDNTVNAIAIASNRPELREQLKDHYAELFEKLKGLGLDQDILLQVFSWFEAQPQLFNNIEKDDFIKIINSISDNKLSDVINDPNPANRVNGISKETGTIIDTSEFGLPQRVTTTEVEQSRQMISESPVVKDNNYSENIYYEVLPSTSNDDNDFSLRTITSKSYKFVMEGLNMKKYEIPDLISICTTQKNGVKEVVSNFFKNLDKDRFTFYVNQLSSNILKTEFILDNKNVEYKDIEQNVKLTYNALAQVKEKTETKENNNRPELT